MKETKYLNSLMKNNHFANAGKMVVLCLHSSLIFKMASYEMIYFTFNIDSCPFL